MILGISLAEEESIFRQAYSNVATRLGFKDAWLYSVPELRDWIRNRNWEVAQALEGFVGDHYSWFQFTNWLSEQKRTPEPAENDQLNSLVAARDKSRDFLLRMLP